ncbi:MAG: ABC transporter ATP-binding protein [Bacteroidales bacterium]
MPGTADSPLEFDAVAKAYEDFALRDVSFSVPPGYIVGLLGPNGAGKTTLMRMALGLASCDAGDVRVFGHRPRQAGAAVRARIGFVHDTFAFCDYLSVEQVAAIVAPFYATWDAARFDRLLAEFGVSRRARVRSLSRGTSMKCALALALSHRAELLLLDEPTTGLDPVFRDELLDRLSATIGDGRSSVLFSTQIVADLERIADYVVLVRDGRLLFNGPKDDILDRWGVVRAAPELAGEVVAWPNRGSATTGQGIEALVEDFTEAQERFGNRALVEKATLEDLFLLCRDPSRGGR